MHLNILKLLRTKAEKGTEHTERDIHRAGTDKLHTWSEFRFGYDKNKLMIDKITYLK